MPLATRLDVETIFQRAFVLEAEENAIDQLLLSAEQLVLNFLKMPVEQAVIVAEKHNVLISTHRLLLKQRPVTVVTAVRENGTLLVEDTNYVVHNLEAGLIHRIAGSARITQQAWERGYGMVEVDYTAGFATVPADVTQVVAEAAYGSWLSLHELGTGTEAAGPVVSKRLDEYAVSYSDRSEESAEFAGQGVVSIGALAPSHQAMLSSYKNRRMG